MSRTYKDKPSKVRFPEVYPYGVQTEKTKKKKTVDTEWHWMTTPSWWNNLFHTKPVRGNFRNFTKTVLKCPIKDLAEYYEPSDSNKPHKYFW